MADAQRIAFLARLYRLLADRPEYLCTDREQLIDRLLSAHIAVGELDRTLILHASELDRLCGYAVRILTQRSSATVLDVLGVLDGDRLTAMFYALPESRHAVVRTDVAWSFHIEAAQGEVEDAIADVERLARETQDLTASLVRLTAHAPRTARTQTEQFERTVLRDEVGLTATDE